MSRIFLSHSSANNAEAVAIRDWMIAQGWDDVFLDLDPVRGLKAGERWQEALKRRDEEHHQLATFGSATLLTILHRSLQLADRASQ